VKTLIRYGLSIAAAVWTGCGEGGGDWDAVVELTYNETALSRYVKRRFSLHSAGVPLRGDLSIDRVRANVMGHTFVHRTPAGGSEAGITAVHAKRHGVYIRDLTRGIERQGIGRHELEKGYHIVDVYAPGGRYAASVAAASAMSGRRILLHLGLTIRHSERIDRAHLGSTEIVRWRSLMPVVVANRGFGYLFRRSPKGNPSSAPSDSLNISALRYELEEVEDFVLIGRDGKGESYRHVFSVGEEYIMSAIQYGGAPLKGWALLKELNLFKSSGTAHAIDSSNAAQTTLRSSTE
jgi:hypothetical protein